MTNEELQRIVDSVIAKLQSTGPAVEKTTVLETLDGVGHILAMSGNEMVRLSPVVLNKGESDNAERITAEVLRATTAESNLNKDIGDEQKRATTAEQTLQTRLSEVAQKQSQDVTALQSLIGLEESRATAAESNLNRDIGNEQKRATAAEQALQTRLSEVAQKQSQDVTALQKLIAQYENRINELETRIAAMENDAVRSRDVRFLKMVTADEHKILVDADPQSSVTCYLIKEE